MINSIQQTLSDLFGRPFSPPFKTATDTGCHVEEAAGSNVRRLSSLRRPNSNRGWPRKTPIGKISAPCGPIRGRAKVSAPVVEGGVLITETMKLAPITIFFRCIEVIDMKTMGGRTIFW